MQPREGQQRRGRSQHRSGDQGQRNRGVRKGLADPNPRTRILTSSTGQRAGGPSPGNQLAPTQASLVGERPHSQGCTLEQAVTMVIDASPHSAP